MQQEGMVEFIGLLKVKVIRGTNLAVQDMMTSDPNVILTLGKQPPGYFLLFELHVKVNIQNIPRRDIRERKTGFPNGFCLNLGFAFTAMYAGLYVCLDKKAGSVAALFCVLCWVQSTLLASRLAHSPSPKMWWVGPNCRIIKLWKSCRLRWTNYLRLDLKRGLLSEYEEKICGMTSWSVLEHTKGLLMFLKWFLTLCFVSLLFSDDINDEFCDATFGPLIYDLIAREGPFLEIACILIAGLTFILWLIVVVSSIVLAVFMNILIGLYASIVVYQLLSNLTAIIFAAFHVMPHIEIDFSGGKH
ncbi:hypothetical protein EV2_028869 [Malus domestica]